MDYTDIQYKYSESNEVKLPELAPIRVQDSKALRAKNEFVRNLRDYMMQKVFRTEHQYTFGEGDYTCEEKNGAYMHVRRKGPEDLMGFCVEKDLCGDWAPVDKNYIIKEIHNFANRNGLESKLTNIGKGKHLNLKIAGREYSVLVSVGKGYADNININLFESLSSRFGNELEKAMREI